MLDRRCEDSELQNELDKLKETINNYPIFKIKISNWSELTYHSLNVIKNSYTRSMFRYVTILFNEDWT